eukprot:scaffold121991_cov30-Tisochrysis_lutea.AAC.2
MPPASLLAVLAAANAAAPRDAARASSLQPLDGSLVARGDTNDPTCTCAATSPSSAPTRFSTESVLTPEIGGALEADKTARIRSRAF